MTATENAANVTPSFTRKGNLRILIAFLSFVKYCHQLKADPVAQASQLCLNVPSLVPRASSW